MTALVLLVVVLWLSMSATEGDLPPRSSMPVPSAAATLPVAAPPIEEGCGSGGCYLKQHYPTVTAEEARAVLEALGLEDGQEQCRRHGLDPRRVCAHATVAPSSPHVVTVYASLEPNIGR